MSSHTHVSPSTPKNGVDTDYWGRLLSAATTPTTVVALRTGRHLRRHATLRDHRESSARLGQAFLRHLRNGHSLSLGEARHHHAERADDHAARAVARPRHARPPDVQRRVAR